MRASLRRLAGKTSGSLRRLAKEFVYVATYGKTAGSTCLCGKKNLRRRFRIEHKQTKRKGVVGSDCIRHFKRKGYHPVVKA